MNRLMALTILNIDTRRQGGIRKIPRESTPGHILKTEPGNMDIKIAIKAGTRRIEDTPVTRRRAPQETTPATPVVTRNLREVMALTATGARPKSMSAILTAEVTQILPSFREETCGVAVGIRRKALRESLLMLLAVDIQGIRERPMHGRAILPRARKDTATLGAGTRSPQESTVAPNTRLEAGKNIRRGTFRKDTAALVEDTRRTRPICAADTPRSVERESTIVILAAVMFRHLQEENMTAAVTRLGIRKAGMGIVGEGDTRGRGTLTTRPMDIKKDTRTSFKNI
jgi:hypothetical protein